MLQPFPGKHTRDFGHSCYALERMFLCSRWLVPLGLPMFNVYLVQLKARLRRPLAKKDTRKKTPGPWLHQNNEKADCSVRRRCGKLPQ